MNTGKKHIYSNFDGAEIKVYKIGEALRLRHFRKQKDISEMVKCIHTHFTFEIFFVTKGNLTVVSNDFVKTFGESVIIIPPQFMHCTFPDSDGCFCLLFSVSKNSFKNINKNSITTIPMTEDIAFYIKKLAEKTDTKPDMTEQKYLSVLLFNELSEMLNTSDTTGNELTSENISKIEHYINIHHNEKLTLEKVSKNVFLSPRQISRIIKKEYGKTFVELVTEKRLNYAEMLLKSGNAPIAEIAEKTFPDNINYFYTVFKKKYGMTPLNYRKQMKTFTIE